MPVAEYTDTGVLENITKPNLSGIKNRSVVVTGGASGLGEAYVRAFAAAGAYVTLADFNADLGQKVADEYPNVQFSKCDVRIWDEQLAAFKLAIANSPANSVDIVIANAGISGADGITTFEDIGSDPTKPDLRITDINIDGVLYTTKLALHYFRAQEESDARDRCLILKASLAGYLDLPGAALYQASKFAVRGVFRNLRRLLPQHGMRVNVVCPWFIETPIMPPQFIDHLKSTNVEFATKEDAAKCMLRIAGDKAINGRAFAILPVSFDAEGYKDIGHDDYQPGDFMRQYEDIIVKDSMRRPSNKTMYDMRNKA